HTLTQTHTYTHSLSHTLCHTHTHSLSLSLTHTHTHTCEGLTALEKTHRLARCHQLLCQLGREDVSTERKTNASISKLGISSPSSPLFSILSSLLPFPLCLPYAVNRWCEKHEAELCRGERGIKKDKRE